jgi:hypothetical protein
MGLCFAGQVRVGRVLTERDWPITTNSSSTAIKTWL